MMNPCLPRESFYPFRTIIRPLALPSWRDGGGWSVGAERVLEFLERLLDEPLTYGLADVAPWRLLSGERADAVARHCRSADAHLADSTEIELALAIMPALVAERPYRCGDAAKDAVINLRAVLYAGAFIARQRHSERRRHCPLAGARCGDGVYCGRHEVERFFARRPALRDPKKAAAQLQEMAAWEPDDFRRLVLATALNPSTCVQYARSRAGV